MASMTPTGRPRVNAGKMWMGGLMAGVVAAGVALVGLLIIRGIFHVHVFIPSNDNSLVNPSSAWYAVASFVAALIATGLLFVMIPFAPQPFQFFTWIVGLATAVAVLTPFTTDAFVSAKIATALLNLAIGLTILTLVSSVGRSATYTVGEPHTHGMTTEQLPHRDY
jgi:hypothetical protein